MFILGPVWVSVSPRGRSRVRVRPRGGGSLRRCCPRSPASGLPLPSPLVPRGLPHGAWLHAHGSGSDSPALQGAALWCAMGRAALTWWLTLLPALLRAPCPGRAWEGPFPGGRVASSCSFPAMLLALQARGRCRVGRQGLRVAQCVLS